MDERIWFIVRGVCECLGKIQAKYSCSDKSSESSRRGVYRRTFVEVHVRSSSVALSVPSRPFMRSLAHPPAPCGSSSGCARARFVQVGW
jgi:hypothetical protein